MADAKDPWHYQWINFDGNLTADFAKLPPVFPLREDLFHKAFSRTTNCKISEYFFASFLFLLYDSLLFTGTNSNQHVSRVENYIQINYMRTVSVSNIAAQLNLDRSYLSRLFKEHTGKSIQQYLMQVRMEEATSYLQNGYSVNETAAFCGYENVTNFSRMFKKFHGVSPAKTKQHGKDT